MLAFLRFPPPARWARPSSCHRATSGSRTPWPTDDPGLSRDGRPELQTLLAERGYDVGEPDGAIGTKT